MFARLGSDIDFWRCVSPSTTHGSHDTLEASISTHPTYHGVLSSDTGKLAISTPTDVALPTDVLARHTLMPGTPSTRRDVQTPKAPQMSMSSLPNNTPKLSRALETQRRAYPSLRERNELVNSDDLTSGSSYIATP